MNLLPTTLTIGGTAYDEAGRVGVGLVLDAWGWDLDGDLSCEFHEEGPNALYPAKPHWAAGTAVSLSTTGPVTRFFGQITSVQSDPSGGWSHSYRAQGPKYLANNLYVTASDGTGRITFNLDASDDDYIPSFAGQSVGQILSYALTRHASALTAAGITTDATTTSQLNALTLVPPTPLSLEGRLWQSLDGVLRQWARNYVSFIGGDGLVRFLDSTAFTAKTLTEGTDLVEPTRFTTDTADCASRVVVRGGPDVAPAYERYSKADLTKAWTGGQESAWTYADFTKPGDASDAGTVSAITSATTVTLLSGDNTKTAAINFWSGRQAWLHLFKSGGTGISFSESRPVTANTAETAGATFTVTLGYPLDNSAAGSYDSYALIGTAAPVATGRVDVWRLYNVANSYVSAHLVKRFPTDVAFFGYYGDSTVLTRYPAALIVDPSGANYPASFKIVPQTGQIRFDEPVVKALNTTANLALGGTHVTAPADLYVLLAYSRGALSSTYPADSAGSPVYAGTSYTVNGLQRTAYIDLPSWIYKGNQTLFDAYAQMMHASLKDTVLTGTVRQYGVASDYFTPGNAISIAGTSYATGQDTAAVPVRSFTLRYLTDGSRGLLNVSEMACSSRRNPATGDRYYVHPTTYQQLRGESPLSQDIGLVRTAYTQGIKDAAAAAAAGPQMPGYSAARSAYDQALGQYTGGDHAE